MRIIFLFCSEMHEEQASVFRWTIIQINEGTSFILLSAFWAAEVKIKFCLCVFLHRRRGFNMKTLQTRLFLSLQGLGTTDTVLIRIMVSRAEIDMLDIKAQFLKMYGKTLHSFIKVRAGHHSLYQLWSNNHNYNSSFMWRFVFGQFMSVPPTQAILFFPHTFLICIKSPFKNQFGIIRNLGYLMSHRTLFPFRETHLVITARSCWSCVEANRGNTRATIRHLSVTLNTSCLVYCFVPILFSYWTQCLVLQFVIPIKPKTNDLLHACLFLIQLILINSINATHVSLAF